MPKSINWCANASPTKQAGVARGWGFQDQGVVVKWHWVPQMEPLRVAQDWCRIGTVSHNSVKESKGAPGAGTPKALPVLTFERWCCGLVLTASLVLPVFLSVELGIDVRSLVGLLSVEKPKSHLRFASFRNQELTVLTLTSNPDKSLMGNTQNLECHKAKVKCQVCFNG